MESVQLLLLLQPDLSLTDFSISQSCDPGLCVVSLPCELKWICQQSPHWRIFVDIFLAASRNTHTQTHVANYLVCVCLAVLRSTTIGTGKLTPDLAQPLTKQRFGAELSSKNSPISCEAAKSQLCARYAASFKH